MQFPCGLLQIESWSSHTRTWKHAEVHSIFYCRCAICSYQNILRLQLGLTAGWLCLFVSHLKTGSATSSPPKQFYFWSRVAGPACFVFFEITKAWIPTDKKHNGQSIAMRTYEGTTPSIRNNYEDRNASITLSEATCYIYHQEIWFDHLSRRIW